MAELVEVGNLYDAWRMAVTTIVEKGQRVVDERGSLTNEVLDLIVNVKNPMVKGRQHPYWYGAKLKDYTDQLLSPDRQGFVYTYGNRFRGHFIKEMVKDGFGYNPIYVDQIDEIVDRLLNSKNSRRATMVTFDPTIDHAREEIPCIISVDFKIRHGDLYTSAYWRSNDMWGAYYPNICGITEVAKTVANAVDVDIGQLTTHSVSAHIYEYEFEAAEALAKRSTKSYRK